MGYKSKIKQLRRINKIESSKCIERGFEYFRLLGLESIKLEDKCWSSMRLELNAIRQNNAHLHSSYQSARLFLYDTLLTERDRQFASMDKELVIDFEFNIDSIVSPMFDLDVRKAGEMLFASGGMADMTDSLLWSFIPKILNRTIDYSWHGIGDWKS